MLKLEKIAKTLEISITLRKRDKLFNGALLRALGYALAIHLVAAVLFQVSPFIIKGSQVVFTPVVVDADLSTGSEAAVIAQIENEENLPRIIREPKGSKLSLPSVPMSMLEPLPMKTFAEGTLALNPFEKLERMLLPEPLIGKTTVHAPVEIVISGPLAQSQLLTVPLEKPNKAPLESYKTIYAVRLDEKTGSLFWFEPLHESINTSLDHEAEKIVRSLRFAGGSGSITESGTVEILFYPEESHT